MLLLLEMNKSLGLINVKTVVLISLSIFSILLLIHYFSPININYGINKNNPNLFCYAKGTTFKSDYMINRNLDCCSGVIEKIDCNVAFEGSDKNGLNIPLCSDMGTFICK